MKLLLTSSGISNPSIEDALVELLGKPIAESSALIIPTAIYPFREGPSGAWRAICGETNRPFSGLGWKSLGVLELTALPSIKEESWVPLVRRNRRAARVGRPRHVPLLLDAAVRAGRPLAVAE